MKPERYKASPMQVPVGSEICLRKALSDPKGDGFPMGDPGIRLASFTFTACVSVSGGPSVSIEAEVEIHFDLPDGRAAWAK